MSQKVNGFIVFVLSCLLLSACSEPEKEASGSKEGLPITLTSTEGEAEVGVHQDGSESAIKDATQFDEIRAAVAVNTKDELMVALQVKQFDRFQKKSIEKKVKKYLESKSKSKEVIVSSDKKIFWEIEKLQEKIKRGSISQTELDKQFQSIKKLSKEQT